MIVHGLIPCGQAALMGGRLAMSDRWMLALYGAGADLGPDTMEYTIAGEVQGKGYKAGGAQLKNPRTWYDDKGAYLTFDDVRFTNSTITAYAGLIYNATRGTAVCVLDFGGPVRSTVGPFDVPIAPDAICFLRGS